MTVAGAPPARRLLANPFIFALCACVLYAAFLVPPLLRAHADPSLLIVAGDRYVDARATPMPVIVRHHSDGYDGQFYAALALSPRAALAGAAGAAGVTFDHPAWRAQRILYPLLAHAAAFGTPRFVPAALLGVNLAALFILAVLARGALPQPVAILLMLWPGFLTALTHDTTEPAACALLAAASILFLRGRLLLFGVTAALAALAREDAILLPTGIALLSIVTLRGTAPLRPRGMAPLHVICVSAASMIPAIAWHLWLAHMYSGAGSGTPTAAQLALPFTGALLRIVAAAVALARSPASGFHGILVQIAAVAAPVFVLLVLVSLAAVAIRRILCRDRSAPLAAGLLCMLALDTLLPLNGPWIDATALYRATAEPWCLGCIILGTGGARLPRWAAPVTGLMALVNAILLYPQIRA